MGGFWKPSIVRLTPEEGVHGVAEEEDQRGGVEGLQLQGRGRQGVEPVRKEVGPVEEWNNVIDGEPIRELISLILGRQKYTCTHTEPIMLQSFSRVQGSC